MYLPVKSFKNHLEQILINVEWVLLLPLFVRSYVNFDILEKGGTLYFMKFLPEGEEW